MDMQPYQPTVEQPKIPTSCVVLDKLQGTSTEQELTFNPLGNDPLALKPNVHSTYSIAYKDTRSGEKFVLMVSSNDYLLQSIGDTVLVNRIH